MLDSQYILLAILTNIYAKYGVYYTLWGYIIKNTGTLAFPVSGGKK